MAAKRAALILFGTLLVLTFPTVALSQGFVSVPCGVPHFLVEPTMYVGYLAGENGASFSLDAVGNGLFGIENLQHELDVRGPWVEFLIPVKSSGRLGVAISTGYLFRINGESEEGYAMTGGGGERNWTADVQLWKFEAAATYRIYPSVTSLVGFRYDSFMVNFRSPEYTMAQGQTPGDFAEFNFNGYIPYIGLMYETNGGSFNGLKAGVVGFPALPGSLEYVEVHRTARGIRTANEFQSGYFLEAFAEASGQVGIFGLGAFVKYSSMAGSSLVDLSGNVPGDQTVQDEFDFKFDRHVWVFGGKVSMSF